MLFDFIVAFAMLSDASLQRLQPFDMAIWAESMEARGDYLCDPRESERQRRRFNRLYKKRIDNLRAKYLAWHGPDPKSGDIIVGGCRPSEGYSKNSYKLQKKLKDFDLTLKSMEILYGNPH